MDIFLYLFQLVCLFLGSVLILRIWAYAVRLHPYNPHAQAILRMSHWLVQPFRRLVPQGRLADWPTLFACWLLALIYLAFHWLLLHASAPPLSIALLAVVTILEWGLNVVLWVTLIQAVVSWVNPMAPIMPVMQTLTAPLLNPIRRLLPYLGGIDFSPLVLLVLAQIGTRVLQQFVYTLLGL